MSEFFWSTNHSAEGSNLRLRDSINKVPEMIEYAHSLGHAGICFTEHESITSSLMHLNTMIVTRI